MEPPGLSAELETDARESDSGGRAKTIPDWIISAAVLILGAAIIFFLTRYNMGRGRFAFNALPYRTWEEYLLVNIVGLALLPFLLVFSGFRARGEEFGFRPADPPADRIAMLFFALMLPVLVVASRQPQFYQFYPMQQQAGLDWTYFTYHQLTYGLYFFFWEFFYRGFLTFGLARSFGFPAAVFLQSVGFGIMHIGKPAPEVYGSFVAGIALGWLAMKGRSFYPCFLLHWAISAAFDILTIHARPGGIF